MQSTEFSFTDEELRQAARTYRQRMIATLPAPAECKEKPSPELHAKITRLIARDLRNAAIRRIGKRVAMLLLCALLGVSTWLAVDTEARASFFQWVREVYEESVLYRYFTDSADDTPETLPTYTLSPLPDGYTETATMGDDFIRMTMFNGPDGMVMLSYQLVQTGTQLEFHSSDYEYFHSSVNGISADFYQSSQGLSNELVWIDESNSVAFRLSAHLEESRMVALAETVKISK